MFKAAKINTGNKSNNSSLFQNNEKVKGTFFQPKLNIGKPGDKYETEADKVADQVIEQSPETEQSFFAPADVKPATVTSGQTALLQNKTSEESSSQYLQKQEEEEEMMQMQPVQVEEEFIQNQPEEEEEIIQQQPEEEEPLQMQPAEQEEEMIQARNAEEETIQQQPEEGEEPLQMQPLEKEEEIVQSQDNEEEETIQQKQDVGNEFAVVETSGGENLHQQPENIQPAMPTPAFNTIQKLEEEEEEPAEIQASEDEERRPVMAEKESQVQAKSENALSVPAGFESGLNGSKGSGSPLPAGVKNQMESGFGTDFSNVRIHTGSEAAQMSRQIGAQAFTHGSDIYFNEGKFNPDSQSGQHLIAHELTHTVQQGASVQPKMVQRQDGDEENTVQPPEGVTPVSENSGEFIYMEEDGVTNYNETTKEIQIPQINVPAFKVRNESRISGLRIRSLNSGGNLIPESQVAETERQRGIWNHYIQDTARRLADEKISEATVSGGYSREESVEARTYFFKGIRNTELAILGKQNELLELAQIPIWDREENPTNFQVDHIFETQLGGQNMVSNYELLEASANSSSGSKIMWELNHRAKRVYDVLDHPYYKNKPAHQKPNLPVRPDRANQYVNKFLHNFNISFLNIEYNLTIESGNSDRFWNFTEISQGQHVNKIEAMTGDEMRELGTEDDPALYISPAGGNRLQIPEGDAYPVINWLPRVNLLQRPDFQNLTLMVDAYRASESNSNAVDASYPQMTWYLKQIPGIYGFYVDKGRTLENALSGTTGVFQSLRLPGMSPVIINSLDITENGFQGIGKVLPDVPLIADADIDIVIDGDGIRLRKLFAAQEINFPAPFFEVNEATLEVSWGTNGLGIGGDIGFSIENLGEGHIRAVATTGGGFDLEGKFSFDSSVFNPAEINVAYRNNIWSISGVIGIPEGKIKGVKHATVTVGYENQTISGSATDIELNVPGITANRISFSYGVNSGNLEFTISAGTTQIPGIQNANVIVTISSGGGGEEGENSENFALNVSGSATFRSVPGLQNPTLTVNYNSETGVIDISSNLHFEHGKVSGDITVGVTNRQITDGEAIGDAGEQLNIYGEGQLRIAITDEFTPELRAKLTPEGDILISGWVNVNLQIGEGYERERTLFSIDVTPIPIFTIGIAQVLLTAGGSLGVYANINPVSIDGRIGFEDFNPANPDSFQAIMEVTARASAEAGLKFDAYLGIMASAAIIYAEGRLVVKTRVGAEAGAEITGGAAWSAARGFEITNATANLDLNIRANASLVLHVGAGIYLYVSRVEVISHDFPIASTDFPPLAQMQASMPVNFQNGSLSEINAQDITIRNNPLDNPQSAGRFLQGAVTDVESGPEETEVTNEKNRIISEIQQYPSIGPANPDYYVLYGKQFLVEELKNNNPSEDWSWLDEELANMEYSEFIDFRTYILSQPCSASRIYEVQMFGINHPSISNEDINILETELQEQEDECLLGADVPNDTDI